MRKIVSNNKLISKISMLLLLVFVTVFVSCEFIDELPEANSIEDETPPTAFFSFTNGQEIDTYRQVTFANQSSNAINYSWDLGDGNTSTEIDPVNTYPGEGSYTVTLTVSDALGQTSIYTETIELIEPEEPAVPDPVLLNPDFDRLPKSSGSDCTCSGWINKSVGDQGESSSGNDSEVLKFDNNEPDHVYQEFAVTPNADYRMEIPILFQSDRPGDLPSQLEIRILAGEGYEDGYSPIYYTDTVEIPQDGFGYTSVAQIEEASNNLLIETLDNPNGSEYRTFTFLFNSGANDSVALFIRGIGGPATGGGGGDFGYNSGDEEIRIDSITITAIND